MTELIDRRSYKPRIDVACNDPDNGLFAGRARALEFQTWDGAEIEFEANDWRGPKFTELPGAIRFCRHKWPILRRKIGNWCWNAYWLDLDVMMGLLVTVRQSGMFDCVFGPCQLYDNWNDAPELDLSLWLANLAGLRK